MVARRPLVVVIWQMFDNSDLTGPSLMASRRTGQSPEILDAGAWKNLFERQR